jgi:hypothetical protein
VERLREVNRLDENRGWEFKIVFYALNKRRAIGAVDYAVIERA